MSETKSKSIYRRGADDGLILGVYMSVCFLCIASTMHSTLLGVCGIAMAAGVPVIVYFMLRRGFRSDSCRTTFSALWVEGIATFFFGGLLVALTAYLYLRFINPAYITSTVLEAADIYGASGDAELEQWGKAMRAMVDGKMLPSPSEVAVNVLWLAVFTGSVLSMILSVAVRTLGSLNQRK